MEPGQTAFVAAVKSVAPAAFALPLATNVMITALIIFRIVQVHREVRKVMAESDTSVYMRLIANIIESCVIYPVVLLISMILYILNSNAQDVVSFNIHLFLVT